MEIYDSRIKHERFKTQIDALFLDHMIRSAKRQDKNTCHMSGASALIVEIANLSRNVSKSYRATKLGLHCLSKAIKECHFRKLVQIVLARNMLEQFVQGITKSSEIEDISYK